MQTRRLQVRRTARYHLLGEAAATEAWILLHGYGQDAAAFLASCGALAAPHRLLLAPEALSRFYLRGGRGPVGASWMTREAREDEIADQRAYLDELCAREVRPEQRLCVLGFSQGAAAACRWAALGARTLAHLVLWSAGVPEDIDGARLAARSERVWLVRGTRDDVTDASAHAEGLARLRNAGVRADLLGFEGGHDIHGPTLEHAPFARLA